jgi:hypothetical protein
MAVLRRSGRSQCASLADCARAGLAFEASAGECQGQPKLGLPLSSQPFCLELMQRARNLGGSDRSESH